MVTSPSATSTGPLSPGDAIEEPTSPDDVLGHAAIARMLTRELHEYRQLPLPWFEVLDALQSQGGQLRAMDLAERVMVHCNAGVSRSPGVALGLCDLRGWATAALERSHPGWNRLVRSVLAAERGASVKNRPRRRSALE